MTLPHFFLPSVDAGVLTIAGDDAAHAVRSLRITAGERITISDGAGAMVEASVVTAGRTLTAEVTGRRAPQPRERPSITIYQGLPKTGKMDDIVQHLTQAGVDRIVPVAMRRSVARWDERKAAAQTERLNRIAREAAMQSRRAWLASVAPIAGVDDVAAGTFVLHEEASLPLAASLPAGAPESLALLTGPEGGIDDAEIAALEARGCAAVNAGRTVFRTELAALVATVVVQARYGRFG